MIGLVLVAALAAGWWAWTTRNDQAMRIGDVAAVVAALIALRLLTRGEALPALLAFGGAGWWYLQRRRVRAVASRGGMTADHARRLLNLPRNATREDVRAAHRRLVARVHPDAGGSADLAAQVNQARDVLLAGKGTNP